MNKFIAGLLIFTLTACATGATTAIVTMQQRAQLSLVQSAPLNIAPAKVTVAVMDNKAVVVMSMEEYSKLALAFEKIQDKLLEQQTVIEQQKKYAANADK